MESNNMPLTDAERGFLKIRMLMPAVLFGFSFVGALVCIYLMTLDWSTASYFIISILVLDIAVLSVLFRLLRNMARDIKSGRKAQLDARIGRKYIKPGKTGQYWLEIAGKEYRVAEDTYTLFEEGDLISVYYGPASGIWLGFAQRDLA